MGTEEYAWREASDFLADVNHEGEHLDFHGLRHTCGAWLAMAGVHPKVVQTVMRHGSITLTALIITPAHQPDAQARKYCKSITPSSLALRASMLSLLATAGVYDQGHIDDGHLRPSVSRPSGRCSGQVGRLSCGPARGLAGDCNDDATADDPMARSARRSSEDAKRCVGDATRCEEKTHPTQPGPVANPLRVADLGDDVREDEAENESTPGRIRTCDLRIRSPLLYPTELPGPARTIAGSIPHHLSSDQRPRAPTDH